MTESKHLTETGFYKIMATKTDAKFWLSVVTLAASLLVVAVRAESNIGMNADDIDVVEVRADDLEDDVVDLKINDAEIKHINQKIDSLNRTTEAILKELRQAHGYPRTGG